MGHNTKKKKKKPRGGRGRAADHAALLEDNQDALAEEITALASIFQEDFKITSEHPHSQFSINVRPYLGNGDIDASATLIVSCLPGYPHKCPKLKILPGLHLSVDDSDKLLQLLKDQANIYAHEGRVMIYDLVEAAQEFLAELASLESHINPALPSPSMKVNLSEKKVDDELETASIEFPCIYSSMDLYSDLSGDTASWYSQENKAKDETSSKSVRVHNQATDRRKAKTQQDAFHSPLDADKLGKQVVLDGTPQKPAVDYNEKKSPAPLLNAADETDEESQDASNSDEESVVDSERSYSSTNHQLEDADFSNSSSNDDHNFESMPESPSSFVTVPYDSASLNNKKDLIMVHLLRQVYASKESSVDLPEILSELCRLGVLTEWAKDLAVAPAPLFGDTFNNAFEQMSSSRCSDFWKADTSLVGDNNVKPNSRYLSDFEVVRSLGHGGFGHVALCKNKLDGRQYAVKKIRLKDKSPHVNEKILREVATLSKLQHHHVVRYYQAWVETEFGSSDHRKASEVSNTEQSTGYSYEDESLSSAARDNKQEYTYLYIQMEYCPKTLRQDFESYDSYHDMEYAWHIFRQIVEGLAHIHSQGIIHRDLTPNNIFFDSYNDIKIGDFGLAKFLQKEQLDDEQYIPTEATGVSIDGTSQVGTYFYTAPEIENRWPNINEKVDMYSLGVIFFELWHPFATAMERHLVLSDLKQKGVLPAFWELKFSKQAALLKRLVSSSPSVRPSAIELLQNDLPPRMEDEWLNDVLRMIQTPEDSYVYDRVISTLFKEERWVTKHKRLEGGSLKAFGDESFINSSKFVSERQESVIENSKEVFKQHCAKRFQVAPLSIWDQHTLENRKTVKVLSQGGNMLELCYEFRTSFVMSVIANQLSSIKGYEISQVFRKAIGRTTPSQFLQGDFDIVGGVSPITDAEVIKVAMDIATRFFPPDAIEVRLNHGKLLESIWSWVGVANEQRQSVAELLSLTSRFSPQSTGRKSNWKFIRRQLIQGLHLSEDVVDRLQKAYIRFCGSADQTLARLRGTLSFDKLSCKALEELSTLISLLRVWSIEQYVSFDVLMPPTEWYYRDLFFQIYMKANNLGVSSEASLLATGGRYDCLVEKMWDKRLKYNPPGAVGVSIALEKIAIHSTVDIRQPRVEGSTSILVCSRGGGGLLHERLELVAELWHANIKADFVPQLDPSRIEQFEYAADHDIKCLVFINEEGLSVKVRHLDLKKEKEIKREELVKFLSDVISLQFRNLTIWA